MTSRHRRTFWRDAFAWSGAVSRLVLPRVVAFGLYANVVALVHSFYRWDSVESGPIQFTGGVLALLLVLRTNGGYERWWEGRRLWGSIVNQCRNLALYGLVFGPGDPNWRERFVRWVAAFPHASRRSLRLERTLPELTLLLKDDAAARRVECAAHMPSYVARMVALQLRQAVDQGTLDRYAFFQAERQRAQLIDHIGACERILKTPLPLVHSIKLRRFIVLYLLALPFAVVGDHLWAPPLVTMLVAYPLLAIDQIGEELQNPFWVSNLSHLPLNQICREVEEDLLGFLEEDRRPGLLPEGAGGRVEPRLPLEQAISELQPSPEPHGTTRH